MVNLCNTRALLAILAMMVGAGLTGCGGSEDKFKIGGGTGTGNGGGTGVPGSGAQTGVASSIVLSYPYTDSITNTGGGFYRRVGKAIVTDEDGNIVSDGTQVTFKIIDSIKAEGTIVTGDGDGITGSVLTDIVPFLSDGTATSFDAAYVYRNGGYRFIEPEDQVFLFHADKADKARSVASGALAATTLNVTGAYANTYPNTVYPTGTTDYVVGASHIGAEVAGVDAAGVLTTGIGSTVDGIVNFAVTYPANPSTLNVGCIDPSIDARYSPAGSAYVILAASVTGSNVSVIDERFCFVPIAGGTLSTSVGEISGSATIKVLYNDGGDLVPTPYESVTATVVVTGGVSVTFSGGAGPGANVYTTGTYGSGSFLSGINVTGGASGDTATITYTLDSEAGVTAEVKVKVP